MTLANPLSSDLDALRSVAPARPRSTTCETNLRQGRRDVALFEIGRVFAPAAGRASRCRARNDGWPSS